MSDELYTPRRLILRHSLPGRQVEDVAFRRGWIRLGWEMCLDDVEETTWHVARGLVVCYMHDLVSGDCALEVAAVSPDDAIQLLSDLASEFDVLSLSELLRAVDEQHEPDELGRALCRLILGAPADADAAVLARVQACLSHTDPVVRVVATYGLLNRPWPQYRHLLRQRIGSDPDQQVRAMARDVLAAYRTSALPEPSTQP